MFYPKSLAFLCLAVKTPVLGGKILGFFQTPLLPKTPLLYVFKVHHLVHKAKYYVVTPLFRGGKFYVLPQKLGFSIISDKALN